MEPSEKVCIANEKVEPLKLHAELIGTQQKVGKILCVRYFVFSLV
jgi:hypothetical protein